MIELLRKELMYIEDGLYYMEQSDTAWSREYTKLCKKRRILKKAIRKLERLEVHNGKD
jgi:hypothetical protein